MVLEVEGSIPFSRPNILLAGIGVSPSGKAPDFDSGIRRFKSCHPSQKNGPLAQPAEHVTFNHGVPRSNRGWITISCTISSVGRATDS